MGEGETTRKWLLRNGGISLQQEDEGELGHLFRSGFNAHDTGHQRGITPASCPQGGVSDEITLTAYITASFLEMNMPANVSLPEAVTTLGVVIINSI